ncbi:MAG: 1-deoxy-D-xylulose-5-phosphate reductoisomerase [Ruminococcaceae bacterium]|nr:1-deoxy-D-xylulose-5-phosphate reductoisomerase [Oscillospiraceae bacterium]
MQEKQRDSLILLGSTGSIGVQTLDVASRLDVPVDALCAHRDVDRIEAQARAFGVRACAMGDEQAAKELKVRLADTPTRVYGGEQGILDMVRESPAKIALNSIIGEAGLLPTLAVLDSDKQLALANKESLVVAGEIVMARAKQKGIHIRPVDSEHCAVAQCLMAGRSREVRKIILTASGGPFFGKTREELRFVRAKDALAHPTWSMGQKITIDSATMMNKGFEIIEASYLFDLPQSSIDVVVHRESIIHSMVEYIDYSIMAQMAVPDMRHCIQHALTDPTREPGVIKPLDLADVGSLTFARPDEETFSMLRLAREAMQAGGAMPAVLNAANEVAVAAFLRDEISFCTIFDAVEQTVNDLSSASGAHTLEDILEYDRQARRLCGEHLTNRGI